VLKFLLGITADFLGHNQVNKAVIAVPAKFDANQRKATADAYKNAGLKVVRVIEEPTAAAVAYKLHKKSNIHHILVYDFGGGTLDVSILYVSKGSVQVYATDGDETLGGSDFDICLSNTIQERIESVTSKKISHTHVQTDAFSQGMVKDLCTLSTIRIKAEEIKKQLTYNDHVEFNCHLPEPAEDSTLAVSSSPQATSVSGSPSSIPLGPVAFTVSKAEDFEKGCQHLFQRALLPVTRLLDGLEMSKDDIDEVVLVGGSTRIPLVKQQLREYFGKELNDNIDPDITVAYGAASILD
jgi:molecular chaperone DnaK (HSP70)